MLVHRRTPIVQTCYTYTKEDMLCLLWSVFVFCMIDINFISGHLKSHRRQYWLRLITNSRSLSVRAYSTIPELPEVSGIGNLAKLWEGELTKYHRVRVHSQAIPEFATKTSASESQFQSTVQLYGTYSTVCTVLVSLHAKYRQFTVTFLLAELPGRVLRRRWVSPPRLWTSAPRAVA